MTPMTPGRDDQRMRERAFRVRRLAVIDLHGSRGTARRLWLVRCEFALTIAVCVFLGVLFCRHGGVTGWILGLALLGIGCNYAVLTGWAIVLWNPQRLALEFQATSIAVDGRSYSIGQWRLAVPFLFLVLASRSTERQV